MFITSFPGWKYDIMCPAPPWYSLAMMRTSSRPKVMLSHSSSVSSGVAGKESDCSEVLGEFLKFHSHMSHSRFPSASRLKPGQKLGEKSINLIFFPKKIVWCYPCLMAGSKMLLSISLVVEMVV